MSAESTSPSLLLRLREPSAEAAWQRFVNLYTPLMHHWARKRLGLANADDLVQEVFAVLVQRLPGFQYDQGKSFRAWLWTVVRHKWIEYHRRRRINPQADPAALDQLMDDAEPFWEADHRQHVVRRGLELIQVDFDADTWKASWEVMACGRSANDVAQEMGLTIGAIHARCFRVRTRLRQELEGLLD